MRGRVHTREFKLQVVCAIARSEKRPAQVCREHRLANSVHDRWRQEYRERGEEAFTPPSTRHMARDDRAGGVWTVDPSAVCDARGQSGVVLPVGTDRGARGQSA